MPDPSAVFAEATAIYLARSGDSIPSELSPLAAIKGALPQRAYIAGQPDDPCALQAGSRGEMMLIIEDAERRMSQCSGGGPLPKLLAGRQTEAGPSDESMLLEWLRLGGWSDAAPPEDVVVRSIERELKQRPLQSEEQGVVVSNFDGLEVLHKGQPLRSVRARVEGPRWMELTAVHLDDELFYLRWQQETTGALDHQWWESHSLWQRTGSGLALLWRVHTAQVPILDAPAPENIAVEPVHSPPDVAAFGDGEAVALVGGETLYALQLNPERGWTSAESLDDSGEATDAFLAGSSDAALAVWQRGSTLHARRFTPRGGWSAPLTVAEGVATEADAVAAVGPSGHAVVSWQQADGSRWVRRMSDSGAWIDAAAVSPGAGHVAIAVNRQGSAALIWQEDSAIRTSHHTRRGSWSSPETLSRENEQPDRPTIAIDRWGRMVAVWRSEIDGQVELRARTALPIRGWSPRTESLLTSRRGPISPPEVVMDPMGEAMVIWLESGVRGALWTRRHTLRRGWDPGEQVLLPGEADPATLAVTMHSDSSVAAAWIGRGSGWTARYIPGMGWGEVAIIETRTAPVGTIRLASYDSSSTLFLWSQGSSDPVQLWAREVP